jgi:hypothetical protein
MYKVRSWHVTTVLFYFVYVNMSLLTGAVCIRQSTSRFGPRAPRAMHTDGWWLVILRHTPPMNDVIHGVVAASWRIAGVAEVGAGRIIGLLWDRGCVYYVL